MLLHIFFNMWWLTYLGTLIEVRRGTLRLAGLVLISAVVSNVGQYFWMERSDPGEPHLFAGMSGRRVRPLRLYLDEGALRARAGDDHASQQRQPSCCSGWCSA